MQVYLELAGHPKANVKRVVLRGTTVIGRSRDCSLRIASGSVSRRHCEVRIEGDAVSVVDLGSSNGTFIDDERLPAGEERSLTPGAKLAVGGVSFLVRYASTNGADPGSTVDYAGGMTPDRQAAAAAIAAPVGDASDDLDGIEVDDADALPVFGDDDLLDVGDSDAENEPTVDVPILGDAAGEEWLAEDEALFETEGADEPIPGGDEPVAEDEPILEDDLILEAGETVAAEPEPSEAAADEDAAFDFLSAGPDEPAGGEKGDEGQLDDFLRQMGRE